MKIIIISLLLIFSLSSFAQRDSTFTWDQNKNVQIETNQFLIETIKIMQREDKGVRYCLSKFADQNYNAILIEGLALTISTIPWLASQKDGSSWYYASGAVGIIGLLVHIDSYKWLTRARVSPSEYGLGVKVKF